MPEDISYKGAEADIQEVLWDGKSAIVKHRIKKGYRNDLLDDELRTRRTREEAKLISDCRSLGVRTPFIYSVDLSDKSILMEKIDAPQLQEIIKKTVDINDLDEIFVSIGRDISKMHEGSIIHGDITTANILVDNKKIIFIDFGLGKYSQLAEDMGTDLLVLKKSLTTIIPDKCDELFQQVLRGYNNKKIDKKINEIESRGRYL